MTALELAQKYMHVLFSEGDVEELRNFFSSDFTFRGPCYEFDSADAYINSLKSDPPRDWQYRMIRSFQDESSACLIYQFSKPGVCTPMAQVFELRKDKIGKILLIYDTRVFT
jgi:hypothetical protein